MKYNFDKIYDRDNTDCVKWDLVRKSFSCEDLISMGIADMDFPTAEPLHKALRERFEHPFFGYTFPGRGVIEAVVERAQWKFGWKIDPEWIIFTPGVIPALHTAVRSLTHPGDEIILQKPVYYPFFPAVTAAGCGIINNELKMVNGRYEMDFADLEKKFIPKRDFHGALNRVKALILCNPHNPVGRVWDKGELTRLGETVIKQGAIVIADEIHCEILYRGNRHVTFATISKEFEQNCIVCMSPSKTFNLAGLQIAAIIIPNKKIRDNFASMRGDIVPPPNLFAYTALEAAYREGDDWLNQVLDYLQGNYDYLKEYFTQKIPGIKVVPAQGTYMVWLDCRGLGMDDRSLNTFIKEKTRLELTSGYLFGEGGSGFERMNIACPRSLLAEALKRIEAAVNDLYQA
jgi:cystathionine beta-lyase